MINIDNYIQAMPKAELHVHIEGSIEPELLFKIAERNQIQLPYETGDDILASQNVGKTNPKQNLQSFIECLDISRGVLRTAQDYEQIAYGYISRCRDENIVYAEIIFDPQQGMRQGVELNALLGGLFAGSKAGSQEFGIEVQWIMNFQRDWPLQDALNILHAARPYRDQIVGIGLDNPEHRDFPKDFAPLFTAAREDDYRLTSHCDVNIPNSLEHIKDCINILGVERIDHGVNSIEDDKVVLQLIEKGIPLTACPTRYAFQSTTSIDDLEMMKGLLDQGVIISLNSDDPAQFGSGWLSQTLIEAQQAGNFSLETMTKFMRNGFSSAWIPADRKATYLAQFDKTHQSLMMEGE